MINPNQDKGKGFIAKKRKRSDSESSEESEQEKFFSLSGSSHKTQSYTIPQNNQLPGQNFNKFKVNLMF